MTDYKANRKAWIDNLRSGKFEQATGVLFDGKGYCCIGVGCVTMGLTPEVSEYDETRFTFDGEIYTAPESFKDWVGLNNNDGEYTTKEGYEWGLTINNDDDGLSFSKIADIIESEPEGLFHD